MHVQPEQPGFVHPGLFMASRVHAPMIEEVVVVASSLQMPPLYVDADPAHVIVHVQL